MIVRFRQCFWTRAFRRRGVQLRKQISQRDPVDFARLLQGFKRGSLASETVHAVIIRTRAARGHLRRTSATVVLAVKGSVIVRCLRIDDEPALVVALEQTADVATDPVCLRRSRLGRAAW